MGSNKSSQRVENAAPTGIHVNMITVEMKFLTDQNFPRTCKDLLEEFGHSLSALN
jgi:hypothetical protein